MSIFDENFRIQLTEIFNEMEQPVEILFFESSKEKYEYCMEAKILLEEVSSLSHKIFLEVVNIDEDPTLSQKYHVEKTPAFILLARENDKKIDYGIRFYGKPSGHEFVSLVNGLLLVSKQDSGLQKDTRIILASLTSPVQLQVFVTPSCPYCPQAVVMAHQMAFESPFVVADMIEANEFPELTRQYNVIGVPKTIINQGAGEITGPVSETVLVKYIEETIQRTERLTNGC